jgi:hypothetical protein
MLDGELRKHEQKHASTSRIQALLSVVDVDTSLASAGTIPYDHEVPRTCGEMLFVLGGTRHRCNVDVEAEHT